ncbi:MAG: MBL fold metallo-hydrolase, partial [Alphaproteobacteria bacterium]|nr:MBL fold metallo-hydrolase [Alphaproteobacteria bacterium]
MPRAVALTLMLALAPTAAEAGDGDYGLTPEPIAPGVYALWGAQEAMTPENGAHIANTGFIVGEAGVLVVEAGPTRAYAEQALAAIAAGADGVMLEVHPRPEEALSDGPQSLTPAMLEVLLRD